MDSSHAFVLDQQAHRPRELARLLRHLCCHGDGSRLTGRNRNGQTARDGTRSVLRAANQTNRVIRPIDDLNRSFPYLAGSARTDIGQAWIQGDSFAAKMRQSGVGGTVDPARYTGQQRQNRECAGQTVSDGSNARHQKTWLLAHRLQIGPTEHQSEQDGDIDAESIPRTDRELAETAAGSAPIQP